MAEDTSGCHLDDLRPLYQAQGKAFSPRPEADGLCFLGGEYDMFCSIHLPI